METIDENDFVIRTSIYHIYAIKTLKFEVMKFLIYNF